MKETYSLVEQVHNELSFEPTGHEGASVGFHVINLGCKVNRVESDAIAAALEAHDFYECPAKEAGVIVVNTCTVTGEAEKKTRKAVRHALRQNEKALVIVTGCSAAINASTYEEMSDRVRIVPKGQIMESVGAILNATHVLRIGESYPTRVGVKIQDGCNNACTYCIVHVARGKATSRDPQEIVREVQAYEAAGIKEIVLTGINLGSYRWKSEDGSETKMRLADLLSQLLLSTTTVRFRIGSIEPRDVDSAVVHLIAHSHGRLCRHLHLPLQSGSARVLKEMHRPYTAEYFGELVDSLYEDIPGLALSTDIIVGFPGETEDDFQDTLAMARRCKFSKIHIFRYSQREGTPAAVRPDQIAPDVKADRAKRLEALEAELAAADLASRRGTTELALVESTGLATTESYHTIQVSDGVTVGDLVECVL